MMGLDRLARALVEGDAELELVDARYDCTPLQWALHGWSEGTSGRRDGIPRVVAVLVGHGARVPADALDSLTKGADAELRDALSTPPPA